MPRPKLPCKTLSLAHILGNKWTIPIMELFPAREGSEMHFNEMQEQIRSIRSRNLSIGLRELRDAQMLEKSPAAVSNAGYRLTENGVALIGLIHSIKELGVQIYGIDASCIGSKCSVCMVTRKGRGA